MKVINLRGTSGSGKSFIVRAIMSIYDTVESHRIEGRKQPIGYTCRREHGDPLFTVGHYETACGGCDTVNGLDVIYGMIQEALEQQKDVIYEGLIVASDWRRCIELRHAHQLVVIGLDTPIKECLVGIQERRTARGDDRPLSSKNTEAKFKALLSQRKYFRDNNVDFRVLNRSDALAACLFHLGLISAHKDDASIS